MIIAFVWSGKFGMANMKLGEIKMNEKIKTV
jgi:hypothetical protein